MTITARIFKMCASRLLTLVAVSSMVAGCGGGGDGDTGAPTIRPKSFDELSISLDGFCSFVFTRNGQTAGAIASGDEETGSFEFIDLRRNSFWWVDTDAETYPNVAQGLTNVIYPTDVSGGTYVYRAINNNQGVLTMTGTGTSPGWAWFSGNIANNNSWMQLFYASSPGDLGLGVETKIIELSLTFTPSNNGVDVNTVTIRQPESPYAATMDTVIVPVSEFRIRAAGSVPENYIGDENPTEYGNNLPTTLGQVLMSCVNGLPDPTKDFTLNFAAEATGLSTGSDDPEEIGTCILHVYDADTNSMKAVVGIDYTWRRILGTDTGELVLSGIPDDPDLDFDAALNGTYTLYFSGTDIGTYTGVSPDVSGTFTTIQ